MFNLGMIYAGKGNSSTVNYTKAIEWLRKAAETGHSKAIYNLGIVYYNGYGVEKNYAKAIALFRKAAALDDKSAQNALQNLNE